MESSTKSLPDTPTASIDDLRYSEPAAVPQAAVVLDPPVDPNPWNDDLNLRLEKVADKERPIRPPDLAIPDDTGGFQTEVPAATLDFRPVVTNEVLSEFDPLVIEEEKAAREAWKTSEAHPPPPRTPSPPLSGPTPLASPQSGASISSSFPSLSAFARSFSIPTIGRSRPASLDVAKRVPSPSTLSSFASRQANQEEADTDRSVDERESHQNSTESSTLPERDKTDPPPFDFQKFLDQMKSRGAEPVSKYLKSYVLAASFLIPC